jgi:5-methylcytosine-specific restriction endonuclease McrA
MADSERRIRFLDRVLDATTPRTCPCGVVFTPANMSNFAMMQVYHDADCRARHERRRPRNMVRKQRSKAVRRRWHALIYERDGGRCYLCGQLVDRNFRFPDIKSSTLDHVMPMSAGGSDDPSNLRLAHLGCNMDKGDRLPYWWEKAAPWAPQTLQTRT